MDIKYSMYYCELTYLVGESLSVFIIAPALALATEEGKDERSSVKEGADDEEAGPARVMGVLNVLRALVLAADSRVDDDGKDVEDDHGDVDGDEHEPAELLNEAPEEVDGVGEEVDADEKAGEDDADHL